MLVGRCDEGAMMWNIYDVVPMWSSKQNQLDAERLHAQQREATLAGELAVALRECAELRATVAGLEARLDQAIDDRLNYYQLFIDATNNLSRMKGGQP
jgi:hypothetical protein